jgi:hypothetical protein
MIKSGRTKLVGHVACNGEMRNVCRVLVAKPKKKRTLGRPNCRWEYNIKINLKEIRSEGVDWNYLARDWCQALENTVMNSCSIEDTELNSLGVLLASKKNSAPWN